MVEIGGQNLEFIRYIVLSTFNFIDQKMSKQKENKLYWDVVAGFIQLYTLIDIKA